MGKQGEKIDGKQKRLDGDTEKTESSRKVIFMINKPEMSKEIIKVLKRNQVNKLKKDKGNRRRQESYLWHIQKNMGKQIQGN